MTADTLYIIGVGLLGGAMAVAGMWRKVVCPQCHGLGYVDGQKTCPTCRGEKEK